MILAVALVGELLSTIGELASQRAETLKRVACLERQLDKELLRMAVALQGVRGGHFSMLILGVASR